MTLLTPKQMDRKMIREVLNDPTVTSSEASSLRFLWKEQIFHIVYGRGGHKAPSFEEWLKTSDTAKNALKTLRSKP